MNPRPNHTPSSQASGTAPSVRYPNLDLLRLFLALEVVVFHLRLHYGSGDTVEPLPAVGCFVMLSGLLIPGSFAASRSYGHFAWKRVTRVVPGFVLSILLALALFGGKFLGGTLLYYVTVGTLGLSVNVPLWSLMLEEILYAFHAASQAFLKIFKPWPVFGVFVLFSALSFAPDPILRYKMGVVACFFAGNLLYFNDARIKRVPAWFSLLGIGLIYIFAVCANGTDFTFPPMSTAAGVLGICLARNLPQIREIPDGSFGVYVYHMPLFQYAQQELHASLLVQCFLTTPLVLALAYASWYGVEKQALKLKNRPPRLRWKTREPKPSVAVEAA